MNSPKVIFIDNSFFSINNRDNNYRLFNGRNNNGKKIFKNCKNKIDYSIQAKKYLFGDKGFFKYSRNEEKANISLLDYDRNNNLFDYMLGSKKDISIMEINNMKRKKIMTLKNGDFATDDEANKKRVLWSSLFDKSNLHLSVLSFKKDYIDENIGIDKLHMELTTNIMPIFLQYCGYQNPKNSMDWVVALHSAFDRNNYHFHIGFIEKKESHLSTDNKMHFRRRLNLNDEELNFMKRQIIISIERAKVFTPSLIKLNKNLEEYKRFFNFKERSFSLKNSKDIDLEYSILRLGFLLNDIRKKSKIVKYNSLPQDEKGKEIKYLTKKIKNNLMNEEDISFSKKEIDKSIEEINNIFLKIDYDNNISNVGFEEAKNSKLVMDKLEKYDNYVLNAIVNHSLYVYRRRFSSNSYISFNDLINEAVYLSYKNQSNEMNSSLLSKNFHNDFNNKTNILKSFNRLKINQDKVAEQFYEMFLEKEKGVFK